MTKNYQIKERLLKRYDTLVTVYYAYDMINNCRFEGGLYRFPELALNDIPLDRISPLDLYTRKHFVA